MSVLFVCCSSEPSGPGVGPECTLVWTSYRSGPPNIWTLELPNGEPKQLTYFPEGCGRWGVALSLDNWVYFGGKQNDIWQLFRMKRSGGAAIKLTDNAQYDGDPTVSPDGDRVCFLTKRWGYTYYDRELASMPSSGGEVTRLTFWDGSDDSPVWSPAGDRIAFVRATSSGRFVVMTLDPDNPDSLETWTPTGDDCYEPRWSPGGDKIVCVLTENGIRDICSIDLPSGEIRNLTGTDWSDEKPSVSPDGKRIAHQVYRNGQWDIAITEMDGSGSFFLTDDPAEDISPCWSPESDWVFWVSYRDGDREIYGTRADGSEPAYRITNSTGDDIRPRCWAR